MWHTLDAGEELEAWFGRCCAEEQVALNYWPQVSVLECELANDMLYHCGSKQRDLLVYDAEQSYREQILFVSADRRTVFGRLTFWEFVRFSDNPITADALHRCVRIARTPEEQETLRRFHSQPGYYCCCSSAGPVFQLEQSYESVIERTSAFALSSDKESELWRALEAEQQSPTAPLAFRAALALASANPEFAAALVKMELKLLKLRLQLICTEEQLRLRFCDVWLPPEYRQQLQVFVAADSLLERYQRQQYPGQPIGGFVFAAPRLRLLQMYDKKPPSALPRCANTDLVEFTHRELYWFARNCLRAWLHSQLDYRFAAADLLWQHQVQPLSGLRPEWTNAAQRAAARLQIADGLDRPTNLYLQQSVVRPRALELRGWFRVQRSATERARARSHHPDYLQGCAGLRSIENEFSPRVAVKRTTGFRRITNYVAPLNAEQLLQQVNGGLLPPCIGAIVRRAFEQHQHPTYQVRLKLASFLRTAGLTLEEAQRFWFLVFSAATAAALDEARFWRSDHGLALLNDYKTNKTTNLGASCKAFHEKALCPLAGDIEDCARNFCGSGNTTLHSPAEFLYFRSQQRGSSSSLTIGHGTVL